MRRASDSVLMQSKLYKYKSRDYMEILESSDNWDFVTVSSLDQGNQQLW